MDILDKFQLDLYLRKYVLPIFLLELYVLVLKNGFFYKI